MDAETKIELLGIFRDEIDDHEAFNRGLERITIDEGVTRNTIIGMVGNTEEIAYWLNDHPHARVEIGSWIVTLYSTDPEDVDFDRDDCPFVLQATVETFEKNRRVAGEKWISWILA